MKKSEFISEIAAVADCKKIDAEKILEAIGEVTLKAVAANDSVPFAFGKIYGVDVAARTARNPRTGEVVDVPAKSGYPKCKFNKAAKE